MNLTLTSVIPRLLAIPSPGEHVPSGLVRRLVREGWTEWDGVPAAGPGVVCMVIGVMNWPDEGEKGLGAKSGKRMRDGGSRFPYGGLGCVHLDSGGLLDAYERWGWPSPGRQAEYAPRGEVIAFDVLRKAGTPGPGGRRGPLRSISVPRWRTWLRWSDALLARPEFHEWLIAYWLREFWAPSWRASQLGDRTQDVEKACVLSRVANSAKGWAKQWASLSADEIASRYVEAKRKDRGEVAAKRTARQVGFALRAAAAIEAVRLPVVP